ncbi:energy transducer TonB [Mucilaginibacter dorajii]|uniref:TonB C-terminal domain-containing protein n=1 Tax=Mucilaginibacter dorajii TaxID=692994 RepID=A0ABP7QQ51_9SPHI|nr:energy transducer TonB [Mucilaginibacter dorajii]MCS3733887.1 hypothetical protein [Mucilaginibacter dorajii]
MKTLLTFVISVLLINNAFSQTGLIAKDTLVKGSIEKNCPGGFAAFNDYISKATRAPAMMFENNKEGCARVAFIIEPDGKLSNIHGTTKLGYQMEDEAIRSIKMSVGWIPSTIDSKNVRTSMEVGIQYKRLSKNTVKVEGKVVD